MKAIQITEFGGPEVLLLADIPEPEISPAQILVQTEAIGVNFIDTYLQAGALPGNPPPGSRR